jgi:hypothetical protein
MYMYPMLLRQMATEGMTSSNPSSLVRSVNTRLPFITVWEYWSSKAMIPRPDGTERPVGENSLPEPTSGCAFTAFISSRKSFKKAQ